MNIMQASQGYTGQPRFVSEVDKYIKMMVVGDALELMLDDNFKSDRSVVQKYGCWRRILPSGDEDEFMTFCKAKYLYE